MRRLVLLTCVLGLGLPGVAAAAEGIKFFSSPDRSVVCRFSSFSGYQELKCVAKRLKGDDGGPLTVRLRKSGRAEQLLFDSTPIEKVGAGVRRFASDGFTCSLAAGSVRCQNPAHHGFLLKLPKPTFF